MNRKFTGGPGYTFTVHILEEETFIECRLRSWFVGRYDYPHTTMGRLRATQAARMMAYWSRRGVK